MTKNVKSQTTVFITCPKRMPCTNLLSGIHNYLLIPTQGLRCTLKL